jgi:hypothetical protein
MFGQDIKSDTITNTELIYFDKPDTCYIHVITNDKKAIELMKNTYLMDHYVINGSRYKFYFPIKSSGRIITNLEGGGIDYEVFKVKINK